jgi:hypothetical protein
VFKGKHYGSTYVEEHYRQAPPPQLGTAKTRCHNYPGSYKRVESAFVGETLGVEKGILHRKMPSTTSPENRNQAMEESSCFNE